MPKSATGLWKRGEVWHIDKRIRGYGRLCESTGAITLEEAERYYVRQLDQIRQSLVYGIKPKHLFRAAATKYLLEHQNKCSIVTDAFHLEQLDKWIGDTTLDQIHDGTLKHFVIHRQEKGRKSKSINLASEIVGRILNLSARSWRDEFGRTCWKQHQWLLCCR